MILGETKHRRMDWMNGEVVFKNSKYEVLERKYLGEEVVYDLRSLKTGKTYLAYSMIKQEAIAHADWYANN